MAELVALCNRAGNALFDGLLWLCRPLGEEGQLLAVALVLGALVAGVFSSLVDQERLETLRDRLRAALFEVWLFRHEPRVVLRAEGELFATNLRYLKTFFLPLAAALALSAPVLLQTYSRFGLAPPAPGTALLLSAELAGPLDPGEEIELTWSQGQGKITPPVREPARQRLVWRVEPTGEGAMLLELGSGRGRETMPLWVGYTGQSVGSTRHQGAAQLLDPRLAGLPASSRFRAIEVEYADAGWAWLLWLTAGSLLAGWAVNTLLASRRRQVPHP